MNEVKELIPTRQSLLSRLKQWDDQEGWKIFFDTYWPLIYRTATKAGLTDAEAQDVVQETVLSVWKNMPDFQYDATKGSFKGWLLNLTRWRVTDQLRKRERHIRPPPGRTSTGTEPVARIVDPVESALERSWDEEWDTALTEAAVERVRKRVDAKQYQIFDLYVFKGWPVSRIGRALKVNRGSIYLAKHRISKLIKKEIAHLKNKPI